MQSLHGSTRSGYDGRTSQIKSNCRKRLGSKQVVSMFKLGQSWDLGIFWRGDRLSMCHSLQTKPIYGNIIMMAIITISVNLDIYLIETKHCQLVYFIINSTYSESCYLEADQPDEKWTRPFNAKCIRFPVVNCGKTLGRIKLKFSHLLGTEINFCFQSYFIPYVPSFS